MFSNRWEHSEFCEWPLHSTLSGSFLKHVRRSTQTRAANGAAPSRQSRGAMRSSQRLTRSSIAVCVVAALTVCHAAFAQICKPVSQRTGELGCWITANAALGQLPQQPIFWHLDTYATRASAEA